MAHDVGWRVWDLAGTQIQMKGEIVLHHTSSAVELIVLLVSMNGKISCLQRRSIVFFDKRGASGTWIEFMRDSRP